VQLNHLAAMMRRRWLLSAFGTVFVLLAAVGAYSATPVRYEGSAQVFLLPSPVSTLTGKAENPFLGFGQSLRITAEVLGRLVTTSTAVDDARAAGATASYQVGIPTDAAGPVLNVIAAGTDRTSVVTTVAYVTDQLEKILTVEQQRSGAPHSSWFTLHKISEQPRVDASAKPRYTRAAAGLAVTALVTLVAVVLVDRRRTRRRAPQTSQPRVAPDPAAGAQPPLAEAGTHKRAATAGGQHPRKLVPPPSPGGDDDADEGRREHPNETDRR
jgi:hypothetical protein